MERVKRSLAAVREKAPLVHNITNYVVMNNTANALLAVGASPVMAHAPEEVEAFAGMAGALVVNIGTLSRPWVDSMKKAIRAADSAGTRWVLDPVGAGATGFRDEALRELVETAGPTMVRGNASEIRALAGLQGTTKGVDSTAEVVDAEEAARELADRWGCTVCISGPEDFLTDGKRVRRVKSGSPLMARVTGMGCTATAVMGAFAAVEEDPLEAAFSAMAVMGLAGQRAAEKAAGPGTLQLHFYDELYGMDPENLVGLEVEG